MHTEDDTKKLKQEISELEKKLQAMQMKMHDLHSVILSNISHDIRTPMNAIVGFANLLTEDMINEEERSEFIDQINTNSADLLQIIDNMVEASQLQCGSISLYEQDCYLNEIMDDLFDYYKELYKIRDKKLNIVLSKGDDDDYILVADRKRLKQVFSNLIDNAIKFTDTGHIEFGYKREHNERITFYVRDSGCGLNKLTEEDMFIPFRSRLHKENGDIKKGAGLGLSVSKSIIELMGGSMWTDISSGKGTCLYFSIPAKNDSEPKKRLNLFNSTTKRNIASLL